MDGSSVEVLLYGKSPEKSQVTIDHRKLPDTAEVTRLKSYWKERLDLLKQILEA